ncbi:hypothetical protein ACNAN0_01260 [Agrilactobacillus fermenti]|uniref:helix-turn-helix domain-containing protein n=1 Tax=Agrilactobacillus fermenti TaxID=2586909 RepID=UPI003A5C10BE
MNFGRTINQIRRDKNISVKALTEDNVSRSTYTRFVEGNTDTSVTTFVEFLERLHVSFNEFLYIDNGYAPNEVDVVMAQMMTNLNQQKSDAMKQILDRLEVRAQFGGEKYHHLRDICSILLSRMTQQPYNKAYLKELTDYLMSRYTWAHYELVLFNSVMFAFPMEVVDAMSERALTNMDRYQHMHDYGMESFRVLVNIVILYLNDKQLNKALKLQGRMEQYDIRPDMMFEKNALIYYRGLLKYLKGDETGKDEIHTSLKVFELLGLTDFYRGFKQYAEMIEKMYGLKSDTDESATQPH